MIIFTKHKRSALATKARIMVYVGSPQRSQLVHCFTAPTLTDDNRTSYEFHVTAAQQAAEKFRLKGDWSRFDLRDKKSSDAEGFIFRKTDETKVFSV